MTMIFGILIMWIVVCRAQECDRRIKVVNPERKVRSILLPDVRPICLDVTPSEVENQYLLLKLPPSLSISYNGKTYESADALHWHCFVMTTFKQCRLWHENIRKTCPGGSTAQPIFGPATVYVNANGDWSQGGSNETTVNYKLIHRFQGFFEECTDLQPATVSPTITSTFLDTTAPATTSIVPTATQNEFITTEQGGLPTTSTEMVQTPVVTTQSPTDLQPPTVATKTTSTFRYTTTLSNETEATHYGLATTEQAGIPTASTEIVQTPVITTLSPTGAKGADADKPLFIAAMVLVGPFTFLILGLLYLCLCKNRNHRVFESCRHSYDVEKAANTHHGTESRDSLIVLNGNSNISTPPGGSHEEVSLNGCKRVESGDRNC